MTLCKGESCSKRINRKRASFNIMGQPAAYCKTCIPVGSIMVDVKNKRCEICSTRSSFGYFGESARFCKEHKLTGMIDVAGKKCELCSTRSSFGYFEESARFCKEHKLTGMIDVASKKCEKCATRATFGYSGETSRFCSRHKNENMIDNQKKKCSHDDCSKQPSFGYSGESARFCSVHREIDMIDVMSKKCEKCSKIPAYGYAGESARFCTIHKECDMIDVINKICPGYNTECPVRTRVNDNKYCLSCDPDDSRRKRFKRYENAFFAYVHDKINIHQREFRVNFDANETAKTCARVDGIVLGDGIIVCIEVDENGHRDYDCDEHRMHLVNGELLQKYPDHSISWVRVNPTVHGGEQWSPKAVNIRNKRFDEVIKKVDEILMTKGTELNYIGF